MAIRVATGRPTPLGAWPFRDGVNFSLFSRHAARVELLLYRSPESPEPFLTVPLDADHHRSGDLWHVWVQGVSPGCAYMYRVEGPFRPGEGMRFNRNKLVVDPYAQALHGASQWDFSRARAFDAGSPQTDSFSTEDNAAWTGKGIIAGLEFAWPEQRPLKTPWPRTVIYETHVRGLTIHPSSAARFPGTYRGLTEKIPYFKDLGVTALELLPIQEFNENELIATNPLTGERLRNYWGYSTVSFFAPKESYSSIRGSWRHMEEFRKMVQALHREGIEIILDVVFNHTAEGNEYGPTLSFRGIDNPVYYLLEEDRRKYKNFSGCGNTLNCNHPVVRQFIRNCLRYWVVEMHIDGFRFDLASILGRDAQGNVASNPPLLESIAEDPILRDVKLIAEAWDAGGAYQVGTFPGRRWSEWNGRYRDDVRRFWRGDSDTAGLMAARLCGSSDIYEKSGKQPLNSINFITCHDGFTLNDLVSYEKKHNEANGEGNRDGSDENFSSNCGAEGESGDPAIESVRLRQIKNMIATLLLSRGVPMLLGGDEFRRTQRGNNNPYCQDNEISWYDWSLLERNRELYDFVRFMIRFRARHPVLSEQEFYTEEQIVWFSASGGPADWSDSEPVLACIIRESRNSSPDRLCLLFNAGREPVPFRLPDEAAARNWRKVADTAGPAPGFHDEDTAPVLQEPGKCLSAARSLVILVQPQVP